MFSKSSKFASATFSPSGNHLITLFVDGSVYLWNLSNFEVEFKTSIGASAKNFTAKSSIESKYLVIGG